MVSEVAPPPAQCTMMCVREAQSTPRETAAAVARLQRAQDHAGLASHVEDGAVGLVSDSALPRQLQRVRTIIPCRRGDADDRNTFLGKPMRAGLGSVAAAGAGTIPGRGAARG